MRRGFTLIELSIVLVIIGLLIGGILVARSMITSAKLQATIKTIQQYNIVVQNFETQYSGDLPGDSNAFSPPGDNDGKIYSADHLLDGGSGAVGEMLNFWVHLNQAGLLSQQFKGNAQYASYTGDWTGFSPALSLGKSCFLNAVTISPQSYYAGGNSWVISAIITTPYGPNFDDCLTPADALSLDTKLDDGNPKSGVIQVNYEYHGPIPQGASPFCTANQHPVDPYDVKGQWTNSFGNQPANPPVPDKIGCSLSMIADW